jgi:hypothetical protein
MNYLAKDRTFLANYILRKLDNNVVSLDQLKLADKILNKALDADEVNDIVWIKNINNNKFFALEGKTYQYKELIKRIPGTKWNINEKRWEIPYDRFYDAYLLVEYAKNADAPVIESKKNRDLWYKKTVDDTYIKVNKPNKKYASFNDHYLNDAEIVRILDKTKKYAPPSVLELYPKIMSQFKPGVSYIGVQARSMVSDILNPRKERAIAEKGLYVFVKASTAYTLFWVEGTKDKIEEWLDKKNVENPPTYHNVTVQVLAGGTQLYYKYSPYTGD